LRQRSLGPSLIHGFGQKTGETQNGGAVGGVALAGKRQAAVQAGPQPVGAKGLRAQRVKKAPSGHHWPHGMGRRGADSDLEYVEDGKKHRAHSQLAGKA